MPHKKLQPSLNRMRDAEEARMEQPISMSRRLGLLRGYSVRLSGFALWCVLAGSACNHAQPLPTDLRQGQQAERDQDPERALTVYEATVQGCRSRPRSESKDPCGTAALRRGQILEQLGRFAEAAGAYSETRSLSRDGRTIARGLVRAAALMAGPLAQPDEAQALCREIVNTWPSEVAAEDALKLFVELGLDRKDPQLLPTLLQLADSLRAHEVLASFALFYAARFLERRHDPAALSTYDEIWKRYPRGPLFDDALFAAARLLREQQRFQEAAERLERLEATFTKALLIGHYNKLLLDEGAILLGEVYLSDLRQPERALATLERFLKRQRTSLLCDDALLLMAEAALLRHGATREENHREACGYLARLLTQYPDGNRTRKAAERREALGCNSLAR